MCSDKTFGIFSCSKLNNVVPDPEGLVNHGLVGPLVEQRRHRVEPPVEDEHEDGGPPGAGRPRSRGDPPLRAPVAAELLRQGATGVRRLGVADLTRERQTERERQVGTQ